MDRFDAMHAFVRVVDSGSYTQAARQLNRHKATVSQQIQQLEHWLGARLLTGSYYGNTVQIWSALFMASALGIVLTSSVALLEHLVVTRRRPA